jgi:hypothetical protein
MAAALLLPGLGASAGAGAGRQHAWRCSSATTRRRRRAPALPNAAAAAAADSQVLRASIGCRAATRCALSVTQDSWSGATPVTTAPASALGNRPLRSGPAGQLVTVGASPMITGRVQLDALDRAGSVDPASGTLQAGPDAGAHAVERVARDAPAVRRALSRRRPTAR